MLPLLTALAALATLSAVHSQTLRFNFAEPPLRSRAAARLHATRRVYLRKQNQGKPVRSPSNARSTTLHKQLVIS